jgi:leader peptidase (prepilin peptidase)/N-methyltransferase
MAMIGVAIVYVVAMAVAHSWQSKHLRTVDLIAARSIDVLIIFWCLWVGTSIGSFLNVVAWRMPRGQSINGRSICPRCRVQLRARDNFPVLGWLALGGRCRTCGLPISVRYPIVESVVGLSITIVAASELFHWSLPFQANDMHRGLLWSNIIDVGGLVTLTYHIAALSVSWAMGLIRMDGNQLPRKLVSFGLATATLPMLVYPKLMVVPWQMDVPDSWQPDRQYLDAIVRVITALVTAIFLARSIARSVCPTADPKLDPLGKGTARLLDLITILSIPILVVGWQASVAVVVIASIVAIAFRPFLPWVDGLGRLAIGMPIAMTIQLMIWSWSHDFAYWPSEGSKPWVLLAWAAVALVIPLWLRDRRSAGVLSIQ